MKNGTHPPALRLTHLGVENWRNFPAIDVPLLNRLFVVGPNASGKSNLLDALRFLSDMARVGGGFQAAVRKPWRGDAARLHSLSAKRHTDIGLYVAVGTDRTPRRWEYEIHFVQADLLQVTIRKERVLRQGKVLVDRPDEKDKKDRLRLQQSYLEQAGINKAFRPLREFLASIQYTHLVPQVIRTWVFAGADSAPFGGDLLKRLAEMPEDLRQTQLAQIVQAVRRAVPSLQSLEYWLDATENRRHLRAAFEHLPGAWLLEDQLSDGTLRLIGLFWALLQGSGPLLLEEPELSLHSEVVRLLPQMLARVQNQTGRQVIVSTHATDLLRDEGIAPDEVLLLQPGPDGATARLARDFDEIKQLLEAGIGLAESVPAKTSPAAAARSAAARQQP
jgi:predicted ATPase